MRQRLLQKQVQKMIMTAKMQQSMHMLQLPVLELNQLISEELETNPVLEEISPAQKSGDAALTEERPAEEEQKIASELNWMEEPDVWTADFYDHSEDSAVEEKHRFRQTLITESTTLQDELIRQFHFINDNPANIPIAEQIIGDIDENGYLSVPPEEISRTLQCPPEEVHHVLSLIQNLEPAGVGARNLKECLLIQLRRLGKEKSPEAAIVENHLPELAGKKYAVIARALKIPLMQVKNYVQRINKLNPKPGRNYAAAALRIIPDIILEKTAQGYEVTINTKNLPVLSISALYRKMLKDKSAAPETLQFIREKLRSAQGLMDGLTQRQYTLERVTKHVIERQREFLEKGMTHLVPLTLKEVAETLGVHPSTISRTVANKYIQTPFGTFALKNFFSQAVSSAEGTFSNQSIKVIIDEIIKTEPGGRPYSDRQIAGLLAKKGIKISRRTAAKYRAAFKIAPAHLRRKWSPA